MTQYSLEAANQKCQCRADFRYQPTYRDNSWRDK